MTKRRHFNQNRNGQGSEPFKGRMDVIDPRDPAIPDFAGGGLLPSTLDNLKGALQQNTSRIQAAAARIISNTAKMAEVFEAAADQAEQQLQDRVDELKRSGI